MADMKQVEQHEQEKREEVVVNNLFLNAASATGEYPYCSMPELR